MSARGSSNSQEIGKILVVPSAPGQLRQLLLNREFLAITAHAPPSAIEYLWEPTFDRLEHALPRAQVVHFCGHGNARGLPLNADEDGSLVEIAPEVLAALFARAGSNVSCVICNFCDSLDHAELLAQHVGFATGVASEVWDPDAIRFAQKFHRALWQGSSFRAAFDSADLALRHRHGSNVSIASRFGDRGDRALIRPTRKRMSGIDIAVTALGSTAVLAFGSYWLALPQVPSEPAIEVPTACRISTSDLNDAAREVCVDKPLSFKVLPKSRTLDQISARPQPQEVPANEQSTIYIYCDDEPIFKTELGYLCQPGLNWYDDRWFTLSPVEAAR